jgi:hypothetical protein
MKDKNGRVLFQEDISSLATSNDEHDDHDHDFEKNMDCSTATSTSDSISHQQMCNDDDHLLPSNTLASVSTARVISVCEIQPSFYLTTPIRRLYEPSSDLSSSNDQSTPFTATSLVQHDVHCSTPSVTDYRHLEYSDIEDENNKENKHNRSTSTPVTVSTDMPNTTEVKRSSLYKFILESTIYK